MEKQSWKEKIDAAKALALTKGFQVKYLAHHTGFMAFFPDGKKVKLNGAEKMIKFVEDFK